MGWGDFDDDSQPNSKLLPVSRCTAKSAIKIFLSSTIGPPIPGIPQCRQYFFPIGLVKMPSKPLPVIASRTTSFAFVPSGTRFLFSHSRRKAHHGNSFLPSPRRRVVKHLHRLWKVVSNLRSLTERDFNDYALALRHRSPESVSWQATPCSVWSHLPSVYREYRG